MKVKNQTYQPIPLIIGNKTILLPGRKSIEITNEQVTSQMIGLKSKGLVKIIK